MDPVFVLADSEWWCVGCGSCRGVDAAGYCLDCSYMVGGGEPDPLEHVIAHVEEATVAAADAGLENVVAALAKAQIVLRYLAGELGARPEEASGAGRLRRAG
jgi:hypothetical protein